jgi:Flp pilus assembly CpaE family ATPase
MPVSEKYSPEEKNNPGARKKEAPDDCSDNKVISEVDRRSQTGLVAVKQKIIVFIKAKGGVGSTVLSLYLSFKFSRLRTLLVDLNFSEGGGDTGYYLDLPKIPNMVFFTEGYSRASLDNSIINIDDNFDILQPPPTYDLSKKIDLQDLYSLIDIARKKYHLVIFDLPNHIDDLYLGTIDMADLAVLVSDSTAGSIGRLSDINERFIYPDLEKILVLNRNSNGNGQQMASESFNLKNGLQDFICLKESEILKGRSDFKKFNFGLIREFDELERKVMAKLLMD